MADVQRGWILSGATGLKSDEKHVHLREIKQTLDSSLDFYSNMSIENNKFKSYSPSSRPITGSSFPSRARAENGLEKQHAVDTLFPHPSNPHSIVIIWSLQWYCFLLNKNNIQIELMPLQVSALAAEIGNLVSQHILFERSIHLRPDETRFDALVAKESLSAISVPVCRQGAWDSNRLNWLWRCLFHSICSKILLTS